MHKLTIVEIILRDRLEFFKEIRDNMDLHDKIIIREFRSGNIFLEAFGRGSVQPQRPFQRFFHHPD